jgi:hypothetical protein
MKQTLQQVEIDWPVEALFNYVADITNHTAWKGTTEACWVESKNKSGAKFIELTGDAVTEYEVAEFVPNHCRAVRPARGLLKKTYFFDFESKGPRTVIRLSARVEPGIFALLTPVFTSQFVQRHNLYRLKEILELDE